MKIAIAAEGNTKDTQISSKGGRAPYYLIFEDNVLTEAFKNPFAIGGGGAGHSVAKVLQEKKIKKVFAKAFGEHMKSSLETRGILYEETAASLVQDIINK